MPITSKDLLDLAQQLVNESSPTECSLRASIGRAYYAVYHEAVIAANHLALPPEKDNLGSHERLFSRFESSTKRLRIIASRMAAAKTLRVEADYRLRHLVSTADARKQLLSCQSIVDELIKLQASNTGTCQ